MPDDTDNHRVGLVCKALVGIEGSVGYPGSNDVDVFPAPAVPWESVERPLGLGDPRVGIRFRGELWIRSGKGSCPDDHVGDRR